jgi:hypothetical protein
MILCARGCNDEAKRSQSASHGKADSCTCSPGAPFGHGNTEPYVLGDGASFGHGNTEPYALRHAVISAAVRGYVRCACCAASWWCAPASGTARAEGLAASERLSVVALLVVPKAAAFDARPAHLVLPGRPEYHVHRVREQRATCYRPVRRCSACGKARWE